MAIIDTEKLVGLHEIAARLGVTYSRVTQLISIAGFPEPVVKVGGTRPTKIWNIDDILAWRKQFSLRSVARRKTELQSIIEALSSELTELEQLK